ncbi:MAG: TMEM175 family protein [Armatimonadota bacterium]
MIDFVKNKLKGDTRGIITTARIETLSDGIFAIVMTLLVLDIKIIPPGTNEMENLMQIFRSLAPKIATYILAFLILGSFWVAHHLQFSYIKRSNKILLWINIVFLMSIAFIPFSTYMIHEYGGHHIVVLLFGANLTVASILLYFNWFYAARIGGLVDKDLDPKRIEAISWKSIAVMLVYVAALLVSLYKIDLSYYVYFLIPVLQSVVGRKFDNAQSG